MKQDTNTEAWKSAWNVLIKWDKANKKLDYYLELLGKDKPSYTQARSYFLNVVKHKIFLEYFIEQGVPQQPHCKMKCFLMLVIGQLWLCFREGKTNIPLINGWVERSKPLFSLGESRFVNAVLRKTTAFFQTVDTLPWSVRYSTPEFLIQRYCTHYGKTATLAYLKWNETPITLYVRTDTPNDFLKATQWPHFYTLDDAKHWPYVFSMVCKGKAYIQDPMTRIPIEQMQLKPNMAVLDLCAAPGGKTRQLLQILGETGYVVAVDLPEHMRRLRENTQYFNNLSLLGKNILDLSYEDFEQQRLPKLYDRVLIDVPCSNTGVIRRKPDVLYRLKSKDFEYLPQLQLALLQKAVNFVKPDGLLVYSTCSIDPEENQGVIDQFIKSHPDFQVTYEHISLPWVDQHDGGGVFCLKKALI